jgi:hypothetical protein
MRCVVIGCGFECTTHELQLIRQSLHHTSGSYPEMGRRRQMAPGFRFRAVHICRARRFIVRCRAHARHPAGGYRI